MKKKTPIFSLSGINQLDYVLKNTHPELHPMYLSSLIDFLGRNMGQMPTHENETALLMRIRGISGLNISDEAIIRNHTILKLTRKNRMIETGLFFIRVQGKNR